MPEVSQPTAERPTPVDGTSAQRSLVVTTLNNEADLPRFIESIESQSIDATSVEAIFVDLGSTDGTLQLIESWRPRRAFRISVHKSGSLAEARNLGIALSHGTWTSFPEPCAVLTLTTFRMSTASRNVTQAQQ